MIAHAGIVLGPALGATGEAPGRIDQDDAVEGGDQARERILTWSFGISPNRFQQWPLATWASSLQATVLSASFTSFMRLSPSGRVAFHSAPGNARFFKLNDLG